MTRVSGINNIDEQAIGLIEKPPDLDHFTGNAFQALLRPEVLALCLVTCVERKWILFIDLLEIQKFGSISSVCGMEQNNVICLVSGSLK